MDFRTCELVRHPEKVEESPFLESDACLRVREIRLLLVALNRGSDGAQERAGVDAALLRT